MDILSKLFSFPIVMIDGDNEERKLRQSERTGFGEEEEAELIIGEAEVPFYDFISITDRWLPTSESREKAINGEFEACGVIFANSGSFVVPWTKKRFKRELTKFAKDHPEEDMVLTQESLLSLKDMIKKNEDNVRQGD